MMAEESKELKKEIKKESKKDSKKDLVLSAEVVKIHPKFHKFLSKETN